MEFVVRYKIMGKAPTVNNQYSMKGYKRFKSAEYMAWERAVARVVRPLGEVIEGKKLHLVMAIGGKWVGRTTGGAPLVKDVDGKLKSIIDCVTKCLGVDDKWVWSLDVRKVECGEDNVEIGVYRLL